MIRSTDGGMVSAGIAVERDQDPRLTVAFHCQKGKYDKHKDKLGDPEHFSIIQGTSIMGNVVERICKTHIGLGVLKDGVSFNNRFLGIEAAPKVWLPSKELNCLDEFVIDGFTTSVQRLTCLGRQIRKENTRGEEFYKANDDTRLPDPGIYIILDQGIIGTGEPEIRATPGLREGFVVRPFFWLGRPEVTRFKTGQLQDLCLGVTSKVRTISRHHLLYCVTVILRKDEFPVALGSLEPQTGHNVPSLLGINLS